MHPTDVDPQETREWLEALDAVVAQRRRPSARSSCSRASSIAPAASARLRPTEGPTPVRQHDPAERRGAVLRRPRARAPHPLARSAGTRSRWSCRPTRSPPSSAATSRATSRRPRSTRSASTTSGTRRPTHHGGDLVYIQGHSSPGIYARAFLEGRLDRGAAAQLPPGGRRRQRAVVVPAPVADAGLLAVPDRLDGPRPADGDLPGALHEVPAGPRPRRHRRAARSGPSWATARWTSPSRWARSRSPAASSSTT